jgi:hypothetical protein
VKIDACGSLGTGPHDSMGTTIVENEKNENVND